MRWQGKGEKPQAVTRRCVRGALSPRGGAAQPLWLGDRRARDPTLRGCRKHEDGGRSLRLKGEKIVHPELQSRS